jgi:DNA repair photolyase
VVNPYVGCAHGCSYCYARVMKRFTRHTEAWGEFVDVLEDKLSPRSFEEATRSLRAAFEEQGVECRVVC